jgi:hypothetical protein
MGKDESQYSRAFEARLDQTNHIIVDVLSEPLLAGPFIACFFTGEGIPPFCEPMERDPLPELGWEFDASFSSRLISALERNSSIHDGAMMIGRDSHAGPYRLLGWSFRLFPPKAEIRSPANRGAAFNSCLLMSMLPQVDCIYQRSSNHLVRFFRGTATVVMEA